MIKANAYRCEILVCEQKVGEGVKTISCGHSKIYVRDHSGFFDMHIGKR